MEANVGIRKYVTNSVGFSGIIKHRYTDFLVNEVDLAGNVVHLTGIQLSFGGEELMHMIFKLYRRKVRKKYKKLAIWQV